MFFVWKPCIALRVKRLAMALVVLPLVALIGACGNDDSKTPDPGAASSNSNNSGNDSGNGSSNGNAAVLSANPAAELPSPAAVTIQSPALPASSADPALSAAASTPLATPVIHTVD